MASSNVRPIDADNLREHLREMLRRDSEAASTLLHTLCQIADQRQAPLYAVGGIVRDLMLGSDATTPPALDIDLAVDGDPAPLLDAMADAARSSPTRHDRFGTAGVVLPDGVHVDLARTRSERYPEPGALPVVQPAPIDTDLQRRDFTVNAAAIVLSGERVGELLDPHGAAADLQRRRIRTLHPRSFEDDPTRLIRAARYAARIAGSIERRTRADAIRDRSRLAALTAGRFGDAWRLLLREPESAAALGIARRLGLPQARDSRWQVSPQALAAADTPEHFWAAQGLLDASPDAPRWLPEIVAMTRSERQSLEAGAQLQALRRRLAQLKRPSDAARALRRFPDPALEAAQRIWGGASGAAVRAHLERRDDIASPITADRLLELGVAPGPDVGAWLERLEAAVWDSELEPADADAIAQIERQIRLSR